MSGSLIPIARSTVGGEALPTVGARDLHAFLEVATAFKDWISRRIEDFDFTEGRDFCSFLGESQGGRPAKEYALTISMAKELAMVERNEKGKQARQYFIECERRANDPVHRLVSMTRPEMLEMALGMARDKEALQAQVVEMQPKAEFHDAMTASAGEVTISSAAKMLGTGQRRLFNKLRELNVLRENNEPYQAYIDRGYFASKPKTVFMGEVLGERIIKQTYVTGKGLAWLQKTFFQGHNEVAS